MPTQQFEDLVAIRDRLNVLVELLPLMEVRSSEVSDWSVGQQIEHVVRATSALTVLILRNRKPDGTGEQLPIKQMLLEHGSIPRGIAQAPEVSLPGTDTSRKELEALILKCRNRTSRLSAVDVESVAPHPYLGEMNRDEILRFMVIHLDHHIGIMRDILRANSIDTA